MKQKRSIVVALLFIALSFAVGGLLTPAWSADVSISAAPEDVESDATSSLLDSTEPSTSSTGKIFVINDSSHPANIFLDGESVYGNLLPGYQLKIKKVPRGAHTLYAAANDIIGYWGPIEINLKRKFTWTLTD